MHLRDSHALEKVSTALSIACKDLRSHPKAVTFGS